MTTVRILESDDRGYDIMDEGEYVTVSVVRRRSARTDIERPWVTDPEAGICVDHEVLDKLIEALSACRRKR